jgi:hypothetical protein
VTEKQLESAKVEHDRDSNTRIEQLPTPVPDDNRSDTRSSSPTDTYALTTYVGQGRLDPFHVYAVDNVVPYVHEVLDHGKVLCKVDHHLTVQAINRKWANVSPYSTRSSSLAVAHPVKTAWYQCAMDNPVAFYALAYASSQHLNFLQCGIDSSPLAATVRLSYKTKAISLINQELSKIDGGPIPDPLLIAILSLGAHGNKPITRVDDKSEDQSPLALAQMLNFYGHVDQEVAHMSALRAFLKQDNSINNIKLPGLLGALRLGDLLNSTITKQIPVLLPDPDVLPSAIEKFEEPDQWPIKVSALPTSIHAMRLLETLVEARALTLALDRFTQCRILQTSTGDCDVTMDELIHARNLVHCNLISLPAANGLWGASFALYDCVRIASRIFSDLVFFPLPAEKKVRTRLATEMRIALDCVTIHNGWIGETDVLLWCCILGLIAAEGVKEMDGVTMRAYLRKKVVACSDALAIHSWDGEDGARDLCKRILWWDHVCDKKGRLVWETAMRLRVGGLVRDDDRDMGEET